MINPLEPHRSPYAGKSPAQVDYAQNGILRHRKLGRISFDIALVLQERFISDYRKTGDGLPVIFSLEHEPVITCGRSTNPSNLLMTPDEYENRGIAVRSIDRGGDVTYHGPGQVVVYPIILLRKHNLRAAEYIELLEEAMIKTCADWGVNAYRKPRHRGCWTDKGKIGAVGVAIKAGGITKHGIAFNVNPDLENFKLIVPCGITDSPVTALTALSESPVDQDLVEMRLTEHIARLLSLDIET
ncbi:MAG TPA: lipoyl(octanoyl) transferase [Firmicutes bacterium]|nr:lipoyl(octanoyl) transferase [Bacillota bacterium]